MLAQVPWRGVAFRMSRLKHVSKVAKADGRDGYIVQYGGQQQTGIIGKREAEGFVRKLLVKEKVIGPRDPAPLKARFRKKAKARIKHTPAP